MTRKLRTRRQRRAYAKQLATERSTMANPCHAPEYATNPTRAEIKLWRAFNDQFADRFVFQARIGIYIADFLFRERNLVVEVDGPNHYSVAGRWHDKLRAEYLLRSGYRTIRFDNSEVFNNVSQVIKEVSFELC